MLTCWYDVQYHCLMLSLTHILKMASAWEDADADPSLFIAVIAGQVRNKLN